MINEDYVSAGVARLLDEKGFNEPTPMVWYNYTEDNGYELEEVGGKFNRDAMLHAPTVNVAVKWLRENHNIHVTTVPTSESNTYGDWEAIICYADDGIDATDNACGHIYADTPEECMDEALKYVLTRL